MARHGTPSAAASWRSGILAITGALAAAPLGAQHDRPRRNVSGAPLPAAEACYDVMHYDLRIGVDPTERAIDGDLTMRATMVTASPAVWLDLDDDLSVSAVELDGAAVPFERTPGRIEIAPDPALAVGKPFAVRVRYGGHPRVAVQPPWRGGFTWAKTPDGQPWIATSCQGEGADLWWPCKDQPSDKPDTFDLWCTVPKGLIVASNGTLVGEPQVDGERVTFHWHSASPISNYCVALNIAPYIELKDTFTCIDGTKMPVSFFVLPQSVAKAKRCMPQFLDHLHVFEQLLGPYPFRAEKYGIAETPHLGMEHQTIIAYGNHFNDEQYDWLHNHELAHEWWGNLVTCRDWKDMWLHEGFGTYMQPLYREVRFGRKEYLAEMLRDQQAMNRTPIAPRETRDSQQIYFGASGNDIYYKGAWVLHTLRWQLGDETFFRALRRFAYPTDAAARTTDGSQVRLVDTDDFVALCSELAGEDLAWFFDVYVHSAGLPELHYAVEGGVLRLRWQVPGDLPFALAVPVTLHNEVVRVAMPGGHGELKVDDFEFLIDREHQVLMRKPVRD